MRHPQLTGFALWAFGICAEWRLPSFVLFGGLACGRWPKWRSSTGHQPG